MSSLSRIFGWTPSKSEEHVEIPPRPIPRPSALRIFTFQSSQSTELGSPQLSPAGYEASSPASSTSSLSPEGGFQSDQYPEPVRRGDPSWVARPRNPFIIFRCEYSREHSKEGKRVRRPPGSQAEKTLSKRAAEAWHQLSSEEKNRFKELADRERDEHARMHPNYRFRPMKRGSKRNVVKRSQVSSSPLTTSPVVAPVPRYPPPAISESLPPPPPPPPPPVDMSAIKAKRRRSASVPSLPMGQHPFISGFWTVQSSKPEMKRSRSVTGNRAVLPIQTSSASPYEALAFDPRLLENNHSSGFYTPEESFSSAPDPGLRGFPYTDHFSNHGSSGHISPLTVVASSLASWNGEPSPVESHLTSTASPWDSSPAVNFDGSRHQHFPTYSNLTHTEAELSLALANYPSGNDGWAASPSQYPPTMNETAVTSNTDIPFAPTDSYEEAEQYALQEYGLGLETRVGGSSTLNEEDAMFALDINDYFHAY